MLFRSVLSLDLDTSLQNEGRVVLTLAYRIRATNSRFNLVYPFVLSDASEVRTLYGSL